MQLDEDDRQRGGPGQVDVGPSELVSGCLLDWCDGDISAAKVGRRIINALSDGFSHPMLTNMSSIGSDQNSHGKLVAMLRSCRIADMISDVTTVGATSQMVKPSQYIDKIYIHYPVQFASIYGADHDLLRDFWGGLLSRPRGRELMQGQHFLRNKTIDELVWFIPMTVHEDAGPCAKQKSANCEFR